VATTLGYIDRQSTTCRSTTYQLIGGNSSKVGRLRNERQRLDAGRLSRHACGHYYSRGIKEVGQVGS
jgi:hypothetical protein